MSSIVAGATAAPSRPNLRPLALPTEHGGWGFLFEPIVLALAVAPSVAGLLVATAFLAAFLVRQPLRLALQDAVRGRVYPRTRWCWGLASGYAVCAAIALSTAVSFGGFTMLLPLAIAAPLGLVQIAFDAKNRSRALLPELCGATAMMSGAAAIALAGGLRLPAAFALSGIVLARAIPSIVYVRTLLTRAHGQPASSWPALVLHAAALAAVAFFASPLAAAAMAILLVRALWLLTRTTIPPARKIGWIEIAFGLLTVTLAAIG